MGDREFYTEEEAAERNIAVTRDVAPPPGSVGSYNALWFDRGRCRRFGRRVVDHLNVQRVSRLRANDRRRSQCHGLLIRRVRRTRGACCNRGAGLGC